MPQVIRFERATFATQATILYRGEEIGRARYGRSQPAIWEIVQRGRRFTAPDLIQLCQQIEDAFYADEVRLVELFASMPICSGAVSHVLRAEILNLETGEITKF